MLYCVVLNLNIFQYFALHFIAFDCIVMCCTVFYYTSVLQIVGRAPQGGDELLEGAHMTPGNR